jgi:glutaredoxin-like protein
MALLSTRDQYAVQARLSAIVRPVTILFFTRTSGASDSARAARQVLEAVVGRNSQLTLDEVDVGLEQDQAARYGITHVPAIVLLAGEADTRIRFLGAPSGYELLSLVEALILAGTGASGLTLANQALIAEHVTEPMDIQVFVTPTCPHCPGAVTLAHRMAVQSPHIRATCVEAIEFMDLTRRYRVTGVPKTVINTTIEIFGTLSEDALVRRALGMPDGPA